MEKRIHNLESLEREIYRLQLTAKNTESKLDENAGYMHRNLLSMLVNSLSCKNEARTDQKDPFFKSNLKNEKIGAFIDKITDRLADHAAGGLSNLLGKLFHKKK